MKSEEMDKDDLREKISCLNGLYVWQLDSVEMHLLRKACDMGIAAQDYGTTAGFFLGLAKVRVY